MEEQTQVAAESVVETETTQTSSPQVEVETTTPQTTEPVTEQPAQTEEQRKAFQDMRLENKRLKEEIELRQQNESAFDAFHPKPQLVSFSSEQYTDPVTGEVNLDQLTRAQEAAITAKVTNQMEERLAQEKDESNARSKFPELFADAELEQEVADRWLAAKLRGEKVTVSEIAGKVSKRFEKAVTKAEQAGAERALSEVTPKEQATLSASGQSSSSAQKAISDSDYDDKLTQVRHGNYDALAEAMASIPWVNKDK